MFSKKNVVLFVVMSVSLFAVAEMPDSGNWFIQQLTSSSLPWGRNVQISESIVAWDSDWGICYYDGTGIYSLQNGSTYCYDVAVSGNSLVGVVYGQGIYYNGALLKSNGASYYASPDVYQNAVVWEGGSGDDFAQTDVYLHVGFITQCLTDNDQCLHNGNSPKIAGDTIAWRSFDGNDNELFLLKNGVIQQLTCNDAEEYPPIISDNGHVAWVTDHGYGWHAHYFDGEHTWQLTIGNGEAWIWGISDEGVLYSYMEEDRKSVV